jgi:hypothetical protein
MGPSNQHRTASLQPDTLPSQCHNAGFGIAGVVLGSIPLIISALEHYGHGVRGSLVRTARLSANPCGLGCSYEEHEGV